jgi:hypothetical protein
VGVVLWQHLLQCQSRWIGGRVSPNARSRTWSAVPRLNSSRYDTCGNMGLIFAPIGPSMAFRGRSLLLRKTPRLCARRLSSAPSRGRKHRGMCKRMGESQEGRRLAQHAKRNGGMPAQKKPRIADREPGREHPVQDYSRRASVRTLALLASYPSPRLEERTFDERCQPTPLNLLMKNGKCSEK